MEERTKSYLKIALISLILLPLIVLAIEKLFVLFIENKFLLAVVFVPLIEESGKISVYFFMRKRKINVFSNFSDVWLSLFIIGFSFAAAENLLYFITENSVLPLSEIASRIILAQTLHSIISTYFAFAYNSKKRFYALVLVVLFHSVWNALIYFELNLILVYLFALVLTVFSIYKFIRIK